MSARSHPPTRPTREPRPHAPARPTRDRDEGPVDGAVPEGVVLGAEPAPQIPAPEPEREPDVVEPTIDDLAAERDRYVDALQRMKAEFDNFRKRSDRERQTIAMRSTRDVVTELLPVMENLERAVDALNDEHDASLVAGVEMVRIQLEALLRGRGVDEIDALGTPFDPTVHEAVLSQPTADQAPGTVVEVVQKGYRLSEAVLRPARVVVAAAIPAPPR